MGCAFPAVVIWSCGCSSRRRGSATSTVRPARRSMRSIFGAAAAASATAAAVVAYQYKEYTEAIAASAHAEMHLPLSDEAQKTNVVRVPSFLTAAEVDDLHALAEELKPQLGSAGRGSNNQAAAYRNGAWETMYMSTDGHFAKERPALRKRLMDLAREVDAKHWNVMNRATRPVVPRCVEYHTVEPGGSLPYPTHYDAGSLVTIDLMLSNTSDFEGGAFGTLEADGSMQSYQFEKGDALLFVSHKFHCVQPVTAGRRNVLVMELWEGEERECAHRCEKHEGHCGHTARMSFWRRALSDIASDL